MEYMRVAICRSINAKKCKEQTEDEDIISSANIFINLSIFDKINFSWKKMSIETGNLIECLKHIILEEVNLLACFGMGSLLSSSTPLKM